MPKRTKRPISDKFSFHEIRKANFCQHNKQPNMCNCQLSPRCPKLRALIIRNFEKRHYCQTTCATSHWTDTQCPLAQLHLPVVPLLFHSFAFQILYSNSIYLISASATHTMYKRLLQKQKSWKALLIGAS